MREPNKRQRKFSTDELQTFIMLGEQYKADKIFSMLDSETKEWYSEHIIDNVYTYQVPKTYEWNNQLWNLLTVIHLRCNQRESCQGNQKR